MDQKKGAFSIVTGASQGLGRAMSEELASLGRNLILVSLPDEGLQALAESLAQKHQVQVEIFETDFSQPHSVYEFSTWVNSHFQVDTLINNVGIGGQHAFEHSKAEYIDAMVQINVRTVSVLTRLLLDNLKAQEKSYILNVASMASFSPIPFKAIYPASKAFVYFFSRTLNEELRGTNVFVSVVHPGPMMTNQRVSEDIIRQGWAGKLGLISTRRIAEISIRQLYRRDSLIIPGFFNKVTWLAMKILPIWMHLYLGSAIIKKEVSTQSPLTA